MQKNERPGHLAMPRPTSLAPLYFAVPKVLVCALGYQPRRVGLRSTRLNPDGPRLVTVVLRPQLLTVLQDPRSKNQALPLPGLFGIAQAILTSFRGISGQDY